MILTVKDLVKRYKEKNALDHFNFEVEQGEVLGLLGPNGCGKTTAINCILSILKFDAGFSRQNFKRRFSKILTRPQDAARPNLPP